MDSKGSSSSGIRSSSEFCNRGQAREQLGTPDHIIDEIFEKIQKKLEEAKKPQLKKAIHLAHLDHLTTTKLGCLGGSELKVTRGPSNVEEIDDSKENTIEEFEEDPDDINEDTVDVEDTEKEN